jgi:ATP-dependent Lon protease
MDLQKKILQHFEGKVVRKDLTSRVKGNAVVPTYVLEYLLGQYCAVDDEAVIEEGVERVKKILAENYVHRNDAEIVKSRIRESGNYKIIDKVNVSLNDKANQYEADFANLSIKDVPVSDRIVKENPKLLSGGGVWSILSVGYNHSTDAKVRWEINDLKPIQVSNVSLEDFIRGRENFSLDEWLDVLLYTIGLNPEFFTRRGKLIQISRLITHVENNYNFIELGPKGTGKSHIFSELSPHGVLVSGGDVSKARLFVNNNGEKIGLVGYWDVVALDEFEQEKGSKRADGDLVKIMQNYMANHSFNRGKETYQATASLAFVGNTKHSIPYMLKHSHLFESIPESYIKGAFIDRMHFYSPGWEVKILKEAVFSKGLGFIVDYLAEILRLLRKYDYTGKMDQLFELSGTLTARDKMAVRKTFSGLVKLLYPHQEVTDDEAKELLEFAMEGRKRVKDQLYIIDETFREHPAEFKFKVTSTGVEVDIETLEKTNLFGEEVKDNEEHMEDIPSLKETVIKLEPKHLVIRDNQIGVSYKKLFADYLKGATKIVLTDPYIRQPYQFRNLLEFCVMLAKNKALEDEVKLHVITWNTQECISESELSFQELAPSVKELGIDLTYEYQNLHDSNILSNNGWRIQLARGLDIFEPRDGRFDPAEYYQERRSCKNCEIIYIKR